MSETKVLNCIVCPMGCEMTATIEGGSVTNVTGNTCPRGAKYAQEEITAPKRMLTSTVRITGGLLPLLPVVSKSPLACAEHLRTITVEAPIAEGATICENILGLGVDIVASRAMDIHAE